MGAGGQDIMVFKGYIFRLQTLSSRTYMVTAEPIQYRNRMQWYTMDQFGEIRPPEQPPSPAVGAPGGREKEEEEEEK